MQIPALQLAIGLDLCRIERMSHKLPNVVRQNGDNLRVLPTGLVRIELRRQNADRRYWNLDNWIVSSSMGCVLFLRRRAEPKF